MVLMTKSETRVAVLLTVLAVTMAASPVATVLGAVLLPVKFLSQGSGNNNCGPVSLAMAGGYAVQLEPTADKVNQINTSVGRSDQDFKSCEDLINAGRAVFGLTLTKHHWDVADIRTELGAGRPLIVAVKARFLSNRGYGYEGDHFLVAIGLDDGHIICNDPGTRNGAGKSYATAEFDQAMKAEGGIVLTGFTGATSEGQRTGRFVAGSVNGLLVMNEDSSGRKRLTSAYDRSPEWSPDGKQIAFVRDDGKHQAIYVVNSDGSSLHKLTGLSSVWEYDPVWSPDGRRIIFWTWDPTVLDSLEIWSIGAEGGDASRVTSRSLRASQPSWSPDGQRIVFSRRHNDANEYGQTFGRLARTEATSCSSPSARQMRRDARGHVGRQKATTSSTWARAGRATCP